MTDQQAMGYVNLLGVLRFFPTEPEARMWLAKRITAWCVGVPGFTPECQAKWLVEKLLAEFDEWPGPKTMAEVFRSRWPIPPQ